MAQEGEKKNKVNLRIHLKGNKYLYGDGYCYWIVRETKSVQKSGKKAGELLGSSSVRMDNRIPAAS